jgi:AraC-type DNA-binding domain-containing proteins
VKKHIISVLKEIRSGLRPETLNDTFRNLRLGLSAGQTDDPDPLWPEEGFTALEEHNYYEMTIQLDKHTIVQIGTAYYDLVPGQFCIIPPGVPHRIKWGSSTDPTANMMWISITPEIVRTSYTIYSKNARSKIWGSDLSIPGNFLINEIFQEKQKNREDSAETIICYINAFLTLILQNLNFQSETSGLGWTSAMVAELQEYIKEHLGSPLSLNDLSAHVSLSPNYLCKVFKQVTGDTITHYTQNLKIEKSIELLRDDSLSIGEIAERLSFCDQFYFSKVFKSYVCMSPQQYRKSLRMQKQQENLL